MANRSRKDKILLYLSDDEKLILDEKWKLSELPSRSDFIRQLIIYGFVYDVNYDGLKEYSKELNSIGKNMAYTRIHAIRSTIGKSVTYICNPEKTDDKREKRQKVRR